MKLIKNVQRHSRRASCCAERVDRLLGVLQFMSFDVADLAARQDELQEMINASITHVDHFNVVEPFINDGKTVRVEQLVHLLERHVPIIEQQVMKVKNT